MAPVQSKPRDFAAIHRKRGSAPLVSFDAEGVAWGPILEVMKTTADLPVVPTLPRKTQLRNFEDAYEGRGHVMKARRPASKECAKFVVGMLDASLQHEKAATVALFGPKDQALLEELSEMYESLGRTLPQALVNVLKKIRDGSHKLRREYRLSPTFMVKDTKAIDALERRSRELFGVGLSVLAGPLNFLYKNREQSVAHCRTLLGMDASNPKGGVSGSATARPHPKSSPPLAGPKPPPVSAAALGANLFDPTDQDVISVGDEWAWFSQGDVATAPPYNPANSDQVQVYGQHVWLPRRKKWCELDTQVFDAPPDPAERYRDVVYKTFVWSAKDGAWWKLKH